MVIYIIFPRSGEPYVPGSFAKKQANKLYGQKIQFNNSWEDSVSLFYSWLKKEEGSVRDKQISIGDVSAISKGIKEAEVSGTIIKFNQRVLFVYVTNCILSSRRRSTSSS